MTKEQLDISRQFLNSLDPKRDVSCVLDRKLRKQTFDLAIIIPCYNTEKYVKKAIDSVLYQECKYKISIIAVDDGSKDSTAEILDSYGELDNVLIVHQENGGAAAARNTGLLYADAKYLCFLDSDDYMTEGSLEQLLDSATENDADIVQGVMQSFSDQQADLVKKDFSGKCKACSKQEIPGFPWGKIYKSELFDDVSFPEGYLFEDGIITYLVIPRAEKTYLLDCLVYAYRQNESGATKSFQNNLKSIDAYWLREVLFADMERLGIEIDQTMYEQILDEIALTYVRTNDLDMNVKVSIFFLTTEWFNRLHSRFSTTKKYQTILEKGMELENFQSYCDGCAVLWNSKLAGKED